MTKMVNSIFCNFHLCLIILDKNNIAQYSISEMLASAHLITAFSNLKSVK